MILKKWYKLSFEHIGTEYIHIIVDKLKRLKKRKEILFTFYLHAYVSSTEQLKMIGKNNLIINTFVKKYIDPALQYSGHNINGGELIDQFKGKNFIVTNSNVVHSDIILNNNMLQSINRKLITSDTLEINYVCTFYKQKDNTKGSKGKKYNTENCKFCSKSRKITNIFNIWNLTGLIEPKMSSLPGYGFLFYTSIISKLNMIIDVFDVNIQTYYNIRAILSVEERGYQFSIEYCIESIFGELEQFITYLERFSKNDKLDADSYVHNSVQYLYLTNPIVDIDDNYISIYDPV